MQTYTGYAGHSLLRHYTRKLLKLNSLSSKCAIKLTQFYVHIRLSCVIWNVLLSDVQCLSGWVFGHRALALCQLSVYSGTRVTELWLLSLSLSLSLVYIDRWSLITMQYTNVCSVVCVCAEYWINTLVREREMVLKYKANQNSLFFPFLHQAECYNKKKLMSLRCDCTAMVHSYIDRQTDRQCGSRPSLFGRSPLLHDGLVVLLLLIGKFYYYTSVSAPNVWLCDWTEYGWLLFWL